MRVKGAFSRFLFPLLERAYQEELGYEMMRDMVEDDLYTKKYQDRLGKYIRDGLLIAIEGMDKPTFSKRGEIEIPGTEFVCTCNEEDFEEHTCPFLEDVHEDESTCKCCSFCEDNCRDNI